jgi:predicted DNA-binding protein with PD1-like motif
MRRSPLHGLAASALLLALGLGACSAPREDSSAMRVHAFRLLPGDDLRVGIQRYVDEHGIEAGWIATGVGSLTELHLRYADRPSGERRSGRFEIVSLVGTVSKHGSHLHLAVSDEHGATLGGHLLDGCKVYTTAELVLGESVEHVFTRERDGSTAWPELVVRRKP